MSDQRMVCKHCGGEDFHAEVTATGWIDSTGVFLDDSGPHFEPGGGVQDVQSDYDIDRYVCSTCEKGSFRLAELVTPRPAEGDKPIAPCGRCDHLRVDHADARPGAAVQPYYTRGAMPCEHEGCRCHDFYDMEIANAGQPRELLTVTEPA